MGLHYTENNSNVSYKFYKIIEKEKKKKNNFVEIKKNLTASSVHVCMSTFHGGGGGVGLEAGIT